MRGLKLMLVVFAAAVTFDIVTATGSSRSCKKPCGIGSFCDKKKKDCKCSSDRIGNAGFMCYRPRFYRVCQLFADPMINMFDGQSGGIKMPASLSLTRVVKKGRRKSKIELDILAWTKRFGGKHFIEGLQFKLIQTNKDGVIFGTHSYRVIAKTVAGEYYWKIYRKMGPVWQEIIDINPSTKGNSAKDIIPKCTIRFLRLKSKFLYVHLTCCKVLFGIRPYNDVNQDIIPGVWIRVRKTKSVTPLPEWLCNNITDSPQMDVMKDGFGFSSKTQLTTYLGLAHGKPIDYPGAFQDLPDLQVSLKNCDPNIGDLMTKRWFLFSYERLIECMGDDIMPLTYNVTKGYCNNDQQACDGAIDAITTKCPELVNSNKLNNFLTEGCV